RTGLRDTGLEDDSDSSKNNVTNTCRCFTVKTTGSVRYTLLLSLLMAAVMTGELTMTEFLYKTKAIRISPEDRETKSDTVWGNGSPIQP
uniref:Uncharacterized protein n=1 Tax=Paramormyrops kingsleyae TaxID=1676925 RepID=A0A3B3R5C2_9TELE